MFNKLKAFTMAEVLMVLGIIGVVAAITIPNLKDSADEQVYVAKAGKVYSEMETAFSRASMKYGNVNDWSGMGNNTMGTAVGGKMAKYLDGTACGTGANTKCWANGNTLINNGYKIALKDGTTVSFYNDLSVANFANTPITAIVDLDGPEKGPNTEGIDMFKMFILNNSTFNDGSYRVAANDEPDPLSYLAWVLKYGNQDYMKCESNLKWYSTSNTSCN